MTLVFERKTEGPGTHALVIGVGGYPSVRNLEVHEAAESASVLANWLKVHFRNPSAELASIDLLASSPDNDVHMFAFTDGTEAFSLQRPTLRAAQLAAGNWWNRANSHPDNIAIFYFVGQGADTSSDVLLFMDDSADPHSQSPIEGASFSRLSTSMRSCQARRQLFLVDAGRLQTSTESDARPLLGIKQPEPPTALTRAIYYASSAGQDTHVRVLEDRPQRLSIFAEALHGILTTETPPPSTNALTVGFVGERLRAVVKEIASENSVRQEPEINLIGDFDLHYPLLATTAAETVADEAVAPESGDKPPPEAGQPPAEDSQADNAAATPASKPRREKRKAAANKSATTRRVAEPARDEEGTEFVLDDAEAERDELGRSELAIALARRLHKIWRRTNDPAAPAGAETRPAFVVHLDAPWGGGKTTFANFLARILNPLAGGRRRPAAFLTERHPGADLGGIFLEDPPSRSDARARLAALPDDARRPWIVIPFNAWRSEHCQPPWWVFYQAIRQGCFDAVHAEGDLPWRPEAKGADPRSSWLRRSTRWLNLWLRELWWRMRNPKVASLLLTALASAAVLILLIWAGVWGVTKTSTGSAAGFRLTDGVGVLLAGLTGISAFWGLGVLFTESIIPGTDTLAERLSLGSGDPFARFRAHFDRTMKRVRRPVMVVVDDLDRCRPAFVVDLIRGMQTLLCSPRVVFVILGDRDWIERAFESHHDAMSKLDVGPEQTFGARFVEKAIQMSFILPALGSDAQGRYVKRVLFGSREQKEAAARKADEARRDVDKVREIANRAAAAPGVRPFDTGRVLEQVQKEIDALRKASPDQAPPRGVPVEQLVNETLAARAVTDEKVEAEVVHELQRLAGSFPSNPRQIKRIVNTITLYYAVALQRPDLKADEAFRTQLALWIIVMTEWPQTWRLLASFPDLVDILASRNMTQSLRKKGLRLPGSAAVTLRALERIRADAELMEIITGTGEPGHDRLETRYVRRLAELTPLYSRKKRLPEDETGAAAAPARRGRPRSGRARAS